MTITIKRFILLFVGLAGLVLVSKAQTVEEELGFKYVKAKYLVETERYEDAIKAFTDIIKEDANYEDVMLMRAESKYMMGAYKGTKNDVVSHIAAKGINDKAVELLGKADFKLDNLDAALSSLLVATGAVDPDPQVYEFIGTIYQKQGQLLKACDFWSQGAEMGSTQSETKSRKVCGSTKPTTKKRNNSGKKPGSLGSGSGSDELEDGTGKVEDKKTSTSVPMPTTKSNGETSTPDSVDEEESDESADGETIDEPAEEKVDPNLPPDDDTPNEIEVDEDLSITIYGNSLGKRKVLDKPNILIVSDDVGVVAIDICVNKRGKVESAELNPDLSTIEKPSLISLAVRRAKDFWFEKNDYKEQCGVMVFNITGG